MNLPGPAHPSTSQPARPATPAVTSAVSAALAGSVGRVVGTAARRLLSGAGDGQPAWLRVLAEPGDAGWHGPGSAAWAVHGSVSTLVGGIRALLVQAAHPLALAGVVQHSDYRADPLGRLQRTNRFLTSTVYGSTQQAEQAVRRVLAAHRTVAGTAPDGRPYAASDPDLLLWVHVALVESMLVAALEYGPRWVDPDEYVAGMATVARAMGVLDPPTTWAALSDTIHGYLPELGSGPDTRDVVRFLLAPPLPVAAQPAYQVMCRAAVDLLPDWALTQLALPHRPRLVRRADRAACAGLLTGLRGALGAQSPGERAALSRLGEAA